MALKKYSRTQASVGFRLTFSLVSVILEVLLYVNISELEPSRVRGTDPQGWWLAGQMMVG